MDSISSKKKKMQSVGFLSSTRPESNKVAHVETKRKSFVPFSKTYKKIIPVVKRPVPQYLPPMVHSRNLSKKGGKNIPLASDGPATVSKFVKKRPSYDEAHSGVARDYLSPQLIRKFPAESFALLEQLSQTQRLTLKKILKMKDITNLELLQMSKKITDWVTIASREVVLPAVYLYQAITNDLYKRYTQKDLLPQWLSLGDGWMSSAVNHEGVVNAANIFNALVVMTRTNRKEPEDSDESCLAYSGQSTPSPCDRLLASRRKSNLLFCGRIRVNARELTRHIYQTLLNSRLGSVYLSKSWWTMMTPDVAAQRNLEFLSDLLFNFIVYAVKNLLESFLGLPHKIPFDSSMEWSLQSRPGVSSTMSSEEEEALEGLSEVLISRVADMLSCTSETQQSADDGIGEDLSSKDSAVTIEVLHEDPIIYDDDLDGYVSSIQMSGTPTASGSPCTSDGLDSTTTLSAQSLETDTELLMLCRNEDGRRCHQRENTGSSEKGSLDGFSLGQGSASTNSAQSVISSTSVSIPPIGCAFTREESCHSPYELSRQTSDHSLSTFQPKSFESMEETVDVQDKTLKCEDSVSKMTKNKICPEGVVDTVTDRPFCLFGALSALFCCRCREESLEEKDPHQQNSSKSAIFEK